MLLLLGWRTKKGGGAMVVPSPRLPFSETLLQTSVRPPSSLLASHVSELTSSTFHLLRVYNTRTWKEQMDVPQTDLFAKVVKSLNF